MKICLINKYYLPDNGVTAKAAHDLIQYLVKQDYDVSIVSSSARYGSHEKNQIPEYHNLKIRSFYTGKIKLLRLLGACIDSLRLVRKALNTDSDIYIVMTSPPLLNFFAARRFKRKKKKWIYWSLDLYPEAFAANQLISKKSFIYKYVLNSSYNYPPSYLLVLGEEQYKYLKSKFKQDLPYSLIPCGRFLSDEHNLKLKSKVKQDLQNESIHFAYIGNLGEAHSSKFLTTLSENLIPGKHKLSLATYGTKSDSLKSLVATNPCVVIRDYIPQDELSDFDIHLASLQSEWQNICVPSKLVSAVSNKASFLFYGPKDSDSWQYLKDAGWLIDVASDMESQIKTFLSSIKKMDIENKRNKAEVLSNKIKNDVERAYEELKDFLEMENQST